MLPLKSNIISPFKFLNSYQKDDEDSYFGRKKETLKVFELYNDSSLVILHGPSGSGKTSLIYCGLLNKIHLADNSIISIRRNNDLIASIKKMLFTTTKDQVDQSHLLDEFLISHNSLKRTSKGIETIDELIIQVEDKITKLKRRQQKELTPDNTSQNNTTSPITDDFSPAIKKNQEVLKQYIDERNGLLEKLTKKNDEVKQVSRQISKYFKLKNTHLSHIPLIIFDQFEELFVYGTKKEIKTFGLFLKLIFDYKIPFNIIISLREEYFGYLDQLQYYIPHIFYKKIRLAHPDEDTIKEIIEKSFEVFNINQYEDHLLVEKRKELSVKEKNRRIELIIDQIKIHEETVTSYHLPFLQVYLDRLYKMDYYKTYGNEVPEAISKKYGIHPPLEFKEDEIREFGTIESVLEDYIREVSTTILKNTKNKLNNQTKHKDSVIKFLRHFKTSNDLKKRIPIQKKDTSTYIIANQKILNKIQTDIWGHIDEEAYNATISEIINKLSLKGILNISSDYAELSHDIIAKVISNIRIEEDFKSLIKKDFNASFDIFLDTKRKEDLLTYPQIMKIRQYKDFIVHDDVIDIQNRKQRYLDDSIIEVEKEKIEKEKKNIKLRKYFNYSRVISVLLLIAMIALAFYFNEVEKEREVKEISGDIYKDIGKVLYNYEIDKTVSYNTILASEKKHSNLIAKHKKSNIHINSNMIFDLQNHFKQNLYRDYIKAPFYLNSIPIKEGTIVTTKTRRLFDNDSVIYVFALTQSNILITQSLVYKKKNDPGQIIFKKKNILAFEPFKTRDNKLNTLIAQKSKEHISLKLLDQDGTSLVLDEQGNHEITIKGNKLIEIEFIEHDDTFLIVVDNKILRLNLNKLRITPAIQTLHTLSGPIRKIKAFGDQGEYLVLYGDKKLLHANKQRIRTSILNKKIQDDDPKQQIADKRLHDKIIMNRKLLKRANKSFFKEQISVDEDILKGKLPEDDYIYSFKILDNKKILLGLKRSIKRFDLTSKMVDHHIFTHDERISAIDVSSEGDILVGSNDKTAFLLNPDHSYVKKFTGHLGEIQNVSFVKNDENYIVTSDKDHTIKIWNISPIEKKSYSLEGFVNKIKFKDTNEIHIVYKKGNLTSVKKINSDFEELPNNQPEITYTNYNNAASLKYDFIENRNIKITKLNEMKYIVNPDSIINIKYNSNKDILSFITDDNNIYMYNDKNTPLDTLSEHTDKVRDIDFSVDGSYMVSGSLDNKVIIWKIDNDKKFSPIQVLSHTGDIEDVEFYQDNLILSASSDQTVQIYQKQNDNTFKNMYSIILHYHPVTTATFSLDGHYIISGDTNGNIKKWKFRSFEKEIAKRTINFDTVPNN